MIKKISIEDKNYPKLLKKIKNPPKEIYFMGEISSEEKCIAIVGTRVPSSYGKEVAYKLASEISQAGFTVVSGFAPGIDTICHQACVELKKRTIAVLGTGLDKKFIYPKSNLKLIDKILETGGCLISEFPPKTPGSKFSFPNRNRIISGLSLGVVVVEAKMKSGALITAEYAFLQKRKVFAVPGSIFSQTSKGCHFLLKKGAKLVEGIEDILRELKMEREIEEKEEIFEGEREEILILKALKEGALSLDKIVEKTKLPATKVLTLIPILEIQGKIKNLGGEIFSLKRKS